MDYLKNISRISNDPYIDALYAGSLHNLGFSKEVLEISKMLKEIE